MSNILNKKVTLKEIFSDGGTITADERAHLEKLVQELKQNLRKEHRDFPYKISDRGYVEIPTYQVYKQSGDPKYGTNKWSIGSDFMTKEEAQKVADFLKKSYTVDDFKHMEHHTFVIDKSSFGILLDKRALERLVQKFNP